MYVYMAMRTSETGNGRGYWFQDLTGKFCASTPRTAPERATAIVRATYSKVVIWMGRERYARAYLE